MATRATLIESGTIGAGFALIERDQDGETQRIDRADCIRHSCVMSRETPHTHAAPHAFSLA